MRKMDMIVLASILAGASYSGVASAAPNCTLPPGAATVTISNPNLKVLNVRESPNGKVLVQIGEGEEVSVAGPCGPTNAAGLAANKAAPAEDVGEWCKIETPLTGCVKQEFLTAGAPAAPPVVEDGAGIAADPED